MGTMAQVGNAKSRTGITPCGLIRDCWFPSSVAVLISGEERKGSGLLRKDSAGRSAPAQGSPALPTPKDHDVSRQGFASLAGLR
jgi:hypothetical protein